MFEAEARGTEIIVASRHVETGVFLVDGTFDGVAGAGWNAEGNAMRIVEDNAPVLPVSAREIRRRQKALASTAQLSLFNSDQCRR